MTTYLTRELNRILNGAKAPRPAPKSHWEIQWEDGQVDRVTRHGKSWRWYERRADRQNCTCYSSDLQGIRDQLAANAKRGDLQGNLVNVKH